MKYHRTLKSFLVESKNIERDSFIWNMAGNMLMAFQSVIMLMILTRVVGLKEAGVFTIAYANANLFLTIGKFGMRNFQVSDITRQFTFSEYRISRIITSISMMVAAAVYVLIVAYKNGYSIEKSLTIIWMCLFKCVDAVEDIYHGFYQQNGRLDVAGKTMTLRLALTTLVFGIGLLLVKNLLVVVIGVTCVTTVLLIVFIKYTFAEFSHGIDMCSAKKVAQLLKLCFPLFAGSFLSFYIGNAPKYAIDSILSDELQACYGFIAMPVFVIGLLNGFIFSPIVVKMSTMWEDGKIKRFLTLMFRQMMIVTGITLMCLIGAYLLGIPVLSLIYNTDLSPYKMELLILLLGGGFLALSGLMITIITIIRFQKSVVYGYVAVAVIAVILSPVLVRKYLIMGAAVLYLMLMILLCLIFMALLCYGIIKEKKLRAI